MDKQDPAEAGNDAASLAAAPGVDAPGGVPAVSAAHLRHVMGHFASGVVIVGGIDTSGRRAYLPVVLLAVPGSPARRHRAEPHLNGWPRIAAQARSRSSVLNAEQQELSRSFSVSGIDKFEGVAWRTAHTGSPIIEGALAWVDCRIEKVHEAGDHYLVTARVLHAGHLDGQPLLYFRGQYVA